MLHALGAARVMRWAGGIGFLTDRMGWFNAGQDNAWASCLAHTGTRTRAIHAAHPPAQSALDDRQDARSAGLDPLAILRRAADAGLGVDAFDELVSGLCHAASCGRVAVPSD